MDFPKRFKALRQERGLTQKQLSAVFNVSIANISKYENGGLQPNIENIKRMASYFKVTIDYLLGNSDYRDLPADAFPASGMEKIPVIGTIRAGETMLCEENIIEYQYVEGEMVKNGKHFFLKVTGDSMEGAKIHDGGTVLVRQQSDVDDGEIAVVLVDGEATIKRVYKSNGHLILQPANPNYPPRAISGGDVRILGKVILAQVKME